MGETEDERVFAAVMNEITGQAMQNGEEMRKLHAFITAPRKSGLAGGH